MSSLGENVRIVHMRIQRPRFLNTETVLKLWDPPLTWQMASVLPCVGRTEPMLSGIQSTGEAKFVSA